MPIYIKGTHTLRSIDEAFQAKYPNLRVEFFALNGRGELSHAIQQGIGYDYTIYQIGGVMPDASFTFDPRIRIIELERRFREAFHIGMVILRRHRYQDMNTSSSQKGMASGGCAR